MSIKAEHWTLFYSNLPKNQDLNQKMAQIIGFNCFQLGQEEWISNLKQNPDLSMLLVNGFCDLILLHHVNFLQENLFFSELNPSTRLCLLHFPPLPAWGLLFKFWEQHLLTILS
jgi:hypothetical protein